MKIKTKSGITEELDFERIVNQLQQMALEKDYYFTELDINYLIKNIKNEIDNFVKDGEILSVYDLQHIIRLVLIKSKFKWICSEFYV
ncbi:MAG: hypothetical protein SO136_10730 [Sarcina ventriculi]|uniref:ATP-cone domain-containing protein n=1 Tax=Sarcina ventriculi TaxID=1267 RepID=A0ABM9UN12_SARVE|nr:ATP cone domain-containing protein [Sarcina ventriculi]MDO4403314.1 hypothetical protein [Clostridiaceae bacterium]MBU5321889.1 hypothetical protein [Sarcina ventriculi]MCI5637380.1 hypothetical protein [Sarcina ventriculi]MDD7372933.1 hypothetical protein [Sarcina ventriculi]MDY7063369.1 hypothetical protein [Sarcina ventriculi]